MAGSTSLEALLYPFGQGHLFAAERENTGPAAVMTMRAESMTIPSARLPETVSIRVRCSLRTVH